MNRQLLLIYIIAAIIIALLPSFGVYPIFVMKIMCYALFACAFNLLLGYTGLLSFGHAAFFGSAAYATGHSLVAWGFSTATGILFGVIVAMILGVIVGYIAIKRSGIYFAMITLAMAQMIYFYFLQAPFTHGEDGLQRVPRGNFLGIDLSNDLNLYYFVLGIFIIGFVICWRVVHSPFGQALKATRENQDRAISLGYDVNTIKHVVFILSAALAGLAGSAKTVVLVSVTLSDVEWHLSGLVILMTLVGGVGTISGPVVGAIIIVFLENKVGDIGRWLTEITGLDTFNVLGQSVSMVIGIIFIICVMAFRRGVVGEIIYRLKPSLK